MRGEEGGVGKKGEGGGEEMDRGGRWHRYGRKEGEWEGEEKGNQKRRRNIGRDEKWG